ncbi:hypothetical protein HPB52_009310 [Rhipicephalus sanguineus]|uniref:Uncharacterized protein n=1 Tax=Rhipicephalus sanguineus TaxID=34632 RepID=A0A9D4SQ51_RHISA|nr:hypothetical protein HPB52_009310 [Rhipicephalus sanguineus]
MTRVHGGSAKEEPLSSEETLYCHAQASARVQARTSALLSHPKQPLFNHRLDKESLNKPITLGGWHHHNQWPKHFHDRHGIGPTYDTIYNTRGDRFTAQHVSSHSPLRYSLSMPLTSASAESSARAQPARVPTSLSRSRHTSSQKFPRPWPLVKCVRDSALLASLMTLGHYMQLGAGSPERSEFRNYNQTAIVHKDIPRSHPAKRSQDQFLAPYLLPFVTSKEAALAALRLDGVTTESPFFPGAGPSASALCGADTRGSLCAAQTTLSTRANDYATSPCGPVQKLLPSIMWAGAVDDVEDMEVEEVLSCPNEGCVSIVLSSELEEHKETCFYRSSGRRAEPARATY